MGQEHRGGRDECGTLASASAGLWRAGLWQRLGPREGLWQRGWWLTLGLDRPGVSMSPRLIFRHLCNLWALGILNWT